MSPGGEEVAVRGGDQEAEEQLLLALAGGSYLLSTPDGVVAECGHGALALLGVAAEEAAGADAAGLLAGSAGDERDRLAQMLRAGGETVTAGTAQADRPELELTVVPVALALGWEFTSLLGELGTRDPGTWTSAGLRRRHERALDAIAAASADAEREPEAKLAGVLVVLCETQAPPLTREVVHERVVERRATAREAALSDPADPGAGEGAGGGAETLDLHDVVEHARVLRDRLAGAERAAGESYARHQELLAELAEIRAVRDDETERREAAETEAREAAQEAERARHELEALSAAAPREAEDARREAEEAQKEAEAARSELEAARRDLEAARQDLEAAQGAAESARRDGEAAQERAGCLAAELESSRAAADSARAELGVTRSSLQRLQMSASTSGHQAEELRAELAAVRTELEGSRTELEQARAASDALRAQLEDAIAAAQAARVESDAARARASREAQSARAAADAIRAEFALETPAAAANGAAAALSDGGASGQASVLIGPDGVFAAFDEAFCAMLGYRAEQLRAVRWPSVIDRDNADAHRELARRLRAGEIAEAQIETCYMHAQGLLVPIAGTISAVDGDRPPGHLLFRVDAGQAGP